MIAVDPRILLPLAHGFAFLMFLVTWGLLWAQDRRAPANRALRLFLTNMLLWVACEFTLYLPLAVGREEAIWRLTALFWFPSTFWFLVFAYRLVGRRADAQLAAAAVIVAAVTIVYLFTDLGIRGVERHGWIVLDVHGPWYFALALIPLAPGLMVLRLLLLEARRSDDPRHGRALRLIIVGGLLAVAGGLATNIFLPATGLAPGVPHLASIAVVILIPFVQHAIVTLGFMAFDVDAAAEELFEDLRDGVVLLDQEGHPRRMNRSARDLLSAGTGDAAAGLARLAEITGPGGGQREIEVAWPAPGGERDLLVRSSPALRRGVPLGRLVVLRDLTERRRAERVLRDSRDELERIAAERARDLQQSQKMAAVGALASGIAHDLNNLLAAILGFAAAARDDLPEEHPVRSDLDEVLLAARRAANLVGGLLAFGRERPPERRRIDLRKVVGEAVRLIGVNLPSNVILELSAEEAVPVEADPGQIHQIVMNLATNALQAVRDRGGKIGVVVTGNAEGVAGTGDGPWATIAVADDGPGMDPKVAERIFEPFFTTRTEDGGCGLGLPTVARIAAAHGGRVALDSAPGRGTTVEVRFPLAPSVDESQRIVLPLFEGGRERVLFVDDREQMARVVRRLLDPLGYRLTTFTRSEEALAAFAASPGEFDVLLTDLAIPGMDGLELAAKALALRPGLPVVVMTGDASDAARVRAADVGVKKIVEKPLDRSGLARVLRRALDR